MVDSILTNQAPVVQRNADNRSISSAAVANASNVPETEVSETIIDVTPRSMDTDPQSSFSGRGSPDIATGFRVTRDDIELRPPLENFRPLELTSERALENRIADIEIRSNNEIDETDSVSSVNNAAIKSFQNIDFELQQSVDINA